MSGKNKKSIREQMEQMKKEAEVDVPKFDLSGLTTSPIKKDDLNPLPIDADPPVDYEELFKKSRQKSEKQIRIMAMLMMGSTSLLEEEWIREKMEIDIDRLSRIEHQISTLGDKMNDISSNMDMFKEDSTWYKIYLGYQDQQNKNVAHRDKLLESMKEEYRELLEMYQQMHPDKFTKQDDQDDETMRIDQMALNDMIHRVRQEEKEKELEKKEQERKKREEKMMEEMQQKRAEEEIEEEESEEETNTP